MKWVLGFLSAFTFSNSSCKLSSIKAYALNSSWRFFLHTGYLKLSVLLLPGYLTSNFSFQFIIMTWGCPRATLCISFFPLPIAKLKLALPNEIICQHLWGPPQNTAKHPRLSCPLNFHVHYHCKSSDYSALRFAECFSDPRSYVLVFKNRTNVLLIFLTPVFSTILAFSMDSLNV